MCCYIVCQSNNYVAAVPYCCNDVIFSLNPFTFKIKTSGGKAKSPDHADLSSNGSKKGKKKKEKESKEKLAEVPETKDRPLSVSVCVPGDWSDALRSPPTEQVASVTSPEKHKAHKRKL